MKKALLVLLVLAVFRGHAQAPLPAAAPAHADSVVTLRQVFQHARRRARFGAGGYGLVLGTQAFSFASDRPTGSPALLALRVSLSALYTYFLADRRLEAHQPQPGYVEQRLVMAAAKKSR